jgi:hypothetical protein
MHARRVRFHQDLVHSHIVHTRGISLRSFQGLVSCMEICEIPLRKALLLGV